MQAKNRQDNSVETCETIGIHGDVVRFVRTQMPPDRDVGAVADLFKLFGDATRMAILWALSESEMCVCDLCALLRMKQPAISHQLRNLKQARIVRSRREGKVIFYALADHHIRSLLDAGMEHVKEG